MKTIYITLLSLLPVFAFGQQQDSFMQSDTIYAGTDTIRKTDKMAARLNFEAGASYSMFNTQLAQPSIYGGDYHQKMGEGYSGFPAIGITCDFKLKNKLWLRTGFQYLASANQEAFSPRSSNYHYRYGMPINLVWDINKRDDTPFIFGGLWASRVGTTLAIDGDFALNDNGDYYRFRDYGLDVNVGFGKLFYMDGRTYFRMELSYQRSITSLIEKPHKMHLDVLTAKIAFSALIDKRVKNKDTN